jgi:hypothetical protein
MASDIAVFSAAANVVGVAADVSVPWAWAWAGAVMVAKGQPS